MLGEALHVSYLGLLRFRRGFRVQDERKVRNRKIAVRV